MTSIEEGPRVAGMTRRARDRREPGPGGSAAGSLPLPTTEASVRTSRFLSGVDGAGEREFLPLLRLWGVLLLDDIGIDDVPAQPVLPSPPSCHLRSLLQPLLHLHDPGPWKPDVQLSHAV